MYIKWEREGVQADFFVVKLDLHIAGEYQTRPRARVRILFMELWGTDTLNMPHILLSF